jgi:hypothetical protein
MLVMQHEVEELLSPSTRIKAIKIMIDQHHAHDLEPLDLDRTLERPLNHHLEIK